MAYGRTRDAAVQRYFRNKAKDYDKVESQIYWNLSDDLLWYMLEKLVISKMGNKKVRVLDAGGGTGRWIIRIAECLKKSECVIYDISNDMLEVASDKIRKNNLENRIKVVEGDLQEMRDQKSSQYDLAVCFHNVLGFVNDYEKAFEEISRVVKPNGMLVIVVPNKYHMLYFSIVRKDISDLDSIANRSSGRFNKEMPLMHVFTPESIRTLYAKAGFSYTQVLGFPVTIYPQLEDTAIKGSGKRTKEILEDNKYFNRIKAIEKKLVINEETASRGNNLFAIGVKK